MVWSNKLFVSRYYPAYVLKKVDALVSIDVRNYKQDVGCMVFMVEASFDALSNLIKDFQTRNKRQITELHSFMEFIPWIVFFLWI
jgi:hypothetical protein